MFMARKCLYEKRVLRSVVAARVPLPRYYVKKPLQSAAPSQSAVSSQSAASSHAPKTTTKSEQRLQLSGQQSSAIEALKTNKNLIINACAGSGKTTLCLEMAKSMPERQFLLLVYNTRLMEQTQVRVRDEYGLKNISVYNYHSLGYDFYTAECATDEGLKRIVEDDMPVQDGKTLPQFDVLILDEQQDMTPVYYRFIQKVLRDSGFSGEDNGIPAKFCFVGDERQAIYGYNNADERFLTMANQKEVFGKLAGNGKWEVVSLDETYRSTKEIVKFWNEQLLKPLRRKEIRAVASQEENPRPRYIICDRNSDMPFEEVCRLLEQDGLKPEQIAILAYSSRPPWMTNIQILANKLSLKGYPIYVPPSDVTDSSTDVTKGKIWFSSRHQSKGGEWDAVILLGFDMSSKMSDKDPTTTDGESNIPFVAASRAKKYLILFHDENYPELPFIHWESLKQSCEVVDPNGVTKAYSSPEDPSFAVTKDNSPPKDSSFAVTTLTKWIPDSVMAECMAELDLEQIQSYSKSVDPRIEDKIYEKSEEIEGEVVKSGLVEGVSDITGTAIPAIYEWEIRKDTHTLSAFRYIFSQQKSMRQQRVNEILKLLPQKYIERLNGISQRRVGKKMTIEDVLFLANFHLAVRDGYIFKVLNIPDDAYTWVTEEHAKQIRRKIDNKSMPRSKKDLKFEKKCSHEFKLPANGATEACHVNVTISGYLDIHSTEGGLKVWELKTGIFTPEDFIQLALYCAILEASKGGDFSAYLVNALNGNTIQIKPKSKDSLLKIVQKVVAAKTAQDKPRRSNDEFLKAAERDFEGVSRVVLPEWVNHKGRKK
ncbi:P-loop containing nucleoside triphosphate hydrolase protein [Wilcoxina mikolae CBS 423.85]|nr:P-loop containing nucleoside triphosphate hydrolase protein [Wilcoxina mikolae CBS 423.85]